MPEFWKPRCDKMKSPGAPGDFLVVGGEGKILGNDLRRDFFLLVLVFQGFEGHGVGHVHPVHQEIIGDDLQNQRQHKEQIVVDGAVERQLNADHGQQHIAVADQADQHLQGVEPPHAQIQLQQGDPVAAHEHLALVEAAQGTLPGIVRDAVGGHPVAEEHRQEQQQEQDQPDPDHGLQGLAGGQHHAFLHHDLTAGGGEGLDHRVHDCVEIGGEGGRQKDEGAQIHGDDAVGQVQQGLEQNGTEHGTKVTEAIQQRFGVGFLTPGDPQHANGIAQSEAAADDELNQGQDSLTCGKQGTQSHIAQTAGGADPVGQKGAEQGVDQGKNGTDQGIGQRDFVRVRGRGSDGGSGSFVNGTAVADVHFVPPFVVIVLL